MLTKRCVFTQKTTVERILLGLLFEKRERVLLNRDFWLHFFYPTDQTFRLLQTLTSGNRGLMFWEVL